MKELLLASVPGLAVALLAAGTQYARIPTLNRRLDRHLKLRGTIPESQRPQLDGLIQRELDRMIARDARWLSPKQLWAQGIRVVTATLGVGIALGGLVYSRLQPWEVRVTSATAETFGTIGLFVFLAGGVLAAQLDGGPRNPFTPRGGSQADGQVGSESGPTPLQTANVRGVDSAPGNLSSPGAPASRAVRPAGESA